MAEGGQSRATKDTLNPLALLLFFFCDFNSAIIPLCVPPHRCKAVGTVDFPRIVLGLFLPR